MEDFRLSAPPLQKASKKDRSGKVSQRVKGLYFDIAISVFADRNDTRERCQVWAVESW